MLAVVCVVVVCVWWVGVGLGWVGLGLRFLLHVGVMVAPPRLSGLLC